MHYLYTIVESYKNKLGPYFVCREDIPILDGQNSSMFWQVLQAQSTPTLPPDSPATFGHANACFPNWGLTVPIVIFWLMPLIKSGAFRSLLPFLSENFKLSTKGKKKAKRVFIFAGVFSPSSSSFFFL